MQKIIHIDADCFFAALEIRENPALAEYPLAVGGQPGKRGVISTCNYLARQYGVRSAMASSHAKQLCPQLVILQPNFSLYKQVSRQMMEVFHSYGKTVEPLSLDEAFIDVSGVDICRGSGTLMAQTIRREIENTLGITVSAGVAPVKFLAKIASDWRKPNGIYTVSPDEVTEFVRRLPLSRLPGVGKVTLNKLSRHGFYTCEDIERVEELALVKLFGRFGVDLKRMSHGIDERKVQCRGERKSLSIERTFSHDLSESVQLRESLAGLIRGLRSRYDSLDSQKAVASKFVKLKFNDFSQTTLEMSASRCGDLFSMADFERMCHAAWQRGRKPLRLVGLGFHFPESAENPAQLSFPFTHARA